MKLEAGHLLSPGASILFLEILFPPFKAHFAGGDTVALGRSLFVMIAL